ncbi:MAG: adenosine kinase [Rickettsiales bacterium]
MKPLISAIVLSLLFCVNAVARPLVQPDMSKQRDIIGIGDSVVDFIVKLSDEDLRKALTLPYNYKKGDLNFIDSRVTHELVAKMKDPQKIPGGAVSNMLVDFSSLGGDTMFVSVVASDDIGESFVKSLEEAKVGVANKPEISQLDTSQNLVYVTPDGDRTMLIHSGIADTLSQNNIKYHEIKDYKVIYLVGGLWDKGGQKSKAALRALNTAEKVGTLRAFGLHDVYFIDRFRNEFLDVLPQVDVVFCNEKEAKALFQTDSLDKAMKEFQKRVPLAVVTMSEKGANIITEHNIFNVKSVVHKDKVVDTTGAGDAFTAGFLYGYTHGKTLEESAEIAAKAAGEIIQHIGGRPTSSLAKVL